MTSASPPLGFLAGFLVVLAAAVAPAAAQDRGPGAPAGPGAPPFAESTPIEGRYIVLYRKQSAAGADAQAERTRNRGGSIHHVFRRAVKGFAATLPPEAVQTLRNDPDVELVEQDQTVSINATQVSATWGLDRIDQWDRPLSGTYDYFATGAGVTAYVVDTGILGTHTQFAGRLLPGFTSIPDGRGTQDCNGHGTHVAGTIGGTTWGVAKEVKLVPVRVLDCRGSGSWSGVISGIDWVAQNAARPAVANMSLGGGKSLAINSAVAGAAAQGVTMVVAAGNSGRDACSYSPSSEPSAITVGATSVGDARTNWSNYGACVDLFAPGDAITSAWHTGAAAVKTISGTSMASPHVAGAAALVLQGNAEASPGAVTAFLISTATANRLASIGPGSPNLLLYALGTGAAAEPPTVTIAVAALTASASAVTRRQWRATVTISVRDVDGGGPAGNVTVSGSFSPGSNASCVTAASGSCSVSVGLTKSTSATRFTVQALAGTAMAYDASQNAATELTISRP